MSSLGELFRATALVTAMLGSTVPALAQTAAAAGAEKEVRAVIADYNAAYGRNDLETYFKAFASDLTQWFPSGRVDKATYQADWTKYIGAGNRLERVEVRDLQVQVNPAADAAIATYILRVTTRSVAKPSPAMPRIDAGTAIQNGKPRNVMQARPRKAPTIIRSPWTKLTVSVAL